MGSAMMTYMLSADIGEVAKNAVNAVKDVLGDFITGIMNGTIVAWLIDIIKSFISFILTWSENTYNALIGKAYDLLTQHPDDWSPGAWKVVENVNNTLIHLFGSSLLVVFFAIGFCKNSIDPHQELRFEAILKMLIKLSVASWFMYNSIYIVSALFGVVGMIVGKETLMSASAGGGIADFFEIASESLEIGIGELAKLLVVVILSLFYAIMSIGLGMLIVCKAFTRFFKILVIIPYGSIASTTLAGDQQTAHTAASFYKYALNCILEALTMIIVLYIYAKISTDVPDSLGLFDKNAQDLEAVMGRMLTSFILMLTMYGAIKQSSAMTQRALGL